jgi:hypothetical protein
MFRLKSKPSSGVFIVPWRSHLQFVTIFTSISFWLTIIPLNTTAIQQTPWSESASELYEPREVSAIFLRIEGVAWPAQQIPTVALSIF